MKKQEFKKCISRELNEAGITNPIILVSEDSNFLTVIDFQNSLSISEMLFIADRFKPSKSEFTVSNKRVTLTRK